VCARFEGVERSKKEHTNEERGGGRDPGVRRPGAGRGQLPARSKIFREAMHCPLMHFISNVLQFCRYHDPMVVPSHLNKQDVNRRNSEKMKIYHKSNRCLILYFFYLTHFG